MSSTNKSMTAIVVVVIVILAGAGAYWVIMNPPVLPENPYDVAIVFATGGLGDKSFNDGCNKGAHDAVDAFNMNYTYAEPTAISEYEGYIRGYAAHAQYSTAYKLIISVGFDQETALKAVAKDYPNQHFAIVDMFIDPTNYTNVASLLFNENEGSALVGAMAGLVTTRDKIGFVGGMDIPLINKFAGGYIWGANRSNVNVNFTIAYTGDWVNTAAGKSLADGMYAAGFDIIFAAAGRSGLGVIDSAKSTNGTKAYPVWAIGVDSPQMDLGINAANNLTVVLTSMLKRVDIAIYRQFESVFLGTWTGGLKFGTVGNGLVGYEVNPTWVHLDDSVYTYLFSLENEIGTGAVTVPDTKYWIH